MNLVNVAEAGTADAGSGANCGAEDFPPLSFWFLICKVGAVRVPPLEGPSEDRMTQRALHVAWIATWIITPIPILSRSLLLSINFRSAPTTPPCAGWQGPKAPWGTVPLDPQASLCVAGRQYRKGKCWLLMRPEGCWSLSLHGEVVGSMGSGFRPNATTNIHMQCDFSWIS